MGAGQVMTEWVAPIFGVCIANTMFFTPMRAVLRARKEGDLGDLNPIPWPAITGNCAAWLGYSYFKRDWFVYLANQPGFLMGLFYTFSAVGLSSSRTRDVMTAIFLALGLVLPTIAVVLNLPMHAYDEEKKAFVWGMVCNLILVCYYSAPLSTLWTVVQTKSAATLHWPSCLMNLINGTCWVLYGFAIKDYFILSPNVAGMALSLVQMSLIAMYRNGGEGGLGGGSGLGLNGSGGGVSLPRTNSKDKLVQRKGNDSGGGLP